MTVPLRRSGAAPPVRIAHLGLGAFFRAHPAWYTDAVGDGGWGIAAFAGRGVGLSATLGAQDGCYTLIERGPEADRAQIVTSIVRAGPAGQFAPALADPQVAVVTLTVTEAGYRPDAAPARLAIGLAERWRAGGGALAVVPCDNLPANGATLRALTRAAAEPFGPDFTAWMEKAVAFVDTVVDRITPATTPADLEVARSLTGRTDAAPVVAEPFHEWILAGDFPAGRPSWEVAGARFVADVGPFERRKLWLLNGGHSLLAYLGLLRGHDTVAAAMGDAVCREALEAWWDEAAAALDDHDTDAYLAALRGRFANSRIAHPLPQIARDGTQKLPVRILPVLRSAHAAGRAAPGAARVLASWVAWVTVAGPELVDPRAAELRAAAGPRAAELRAGAGADVAGLLAVLGVDPVDPVERATVPEVTVALAQLPLG